MRALAFVLAVSAGGALLGQEATRKQPADSEKLAIREAQLQAAGTYAAIFEAQEAYRKAAARASAMVLELEKKYGCEIDPRTVECKAAAKKASASE